MKLMSIFFFLIFAGCGTFDLRPSAPPTTFAGGYQDYQDVLDTLTAIYSGGGSGNFSGLLDENFRFEADSLDSIAINAPFRAWDKIKETQLTGSLLADSTMRFNGTLSDVTASIFYSSADSVVVEWKYRLTRKDGAIIQGFSDFTLTRALSRFYLLRWLDRSDPLATGAISWGRWKMEHLQ